MYYNEEFKRNVVSRYIAGDSVPTIHKDTGVSRSTIYEWINSSKESFSITAMQKTIDCQRRKIKRLENMIEIIQNTDFFKNVSLSDKLEVIDEVWEEYGINASCDALDVARGTFHNHQKRGKGKNYLHEKRKKELLPEILKVDQEFHHIYGANKITAELKNRGFNASKNTILKIMEEEHIRSLRMDKNYHAFLNSEKKNVLNRKFDMDKPNQAWVSDVTYLQIDENRPKCYFLCVIMDLYSRKVIAHSVGENNSKRLINLTLKKAVEERGIHKDLVFHSDRGSNYTSKSFGDLINGYGFIQSFSKPGTPYDNAVIESFFQNFKIECFNHYFNIKSKKELINIVDEYVNFYNIKRSHSYLNYVSPNQYEERCFNKQMKNI
ncbi:IS3 family transposase [Ruminococcus sp.]|uniref:IS3 family transposase n=1 Tax=Ruminococcus sp. TaxID=41978 RepID=UPI003FD8EE8C